MSLILHARKAILRTNLNTKIEERERLCEHALEALQSGGLTEQASAVAEKLSRLREAKGAAAGDALQQVRHGPQHRAPQTPARAVLRRARPIPLSRIPLRSKSTPG